VSGRTRRTIEKFIIQSHKAMHGFLTFAALFTEFFWLNEIIAKAGYYK